MRYRRADMSGGTDFFTVNLAERKRTLPVDQVVVLREGMREVKRRDPFHIDAMGISPDHLHVLWSQPEGNAKCNALDADQGEVFPTHSSGRMAQPKLHRQRRTGF